jgi:hypothetical protein
MDEDLLTRNLTSGPAWLRALYMVLFGVALYLAMWVAIGIAVIQLVAKLISGTSLVRLDAFGAQLAAYMRELVAFLTFASEEKPFPLAPWPEVEPAEPTPVSVSDRPDP